LLPHVLPYVHQAGEAEISLVLASLAFKAACYLGVCGRYVEAEPLFQNTLRIREQALGTDHPDVATTLLSMAIIHREQGKYAEAEPLYQRVLRIQEQALGPNHLDVAATLTNFAVLCWEQGKYSEAEPLYQRAL
jgi:tetratricopeptide (TPR) repeat protein